MVIMIICLILSVFVGIGTYFYIKLTGPQAKAKKRAMEKAKAAGKIEDDNVTSLSSKEIKLIKKIWEITDIRDGVLKLTNNRYRAYVRLGSIDYWLLSESEQTVIENQLMQAALSFQFNVQFFTTTEYINTQSTVDEITKVADNEDYSDKLRVYASKMRIFLNEMMENRGVYTRKSYAVICVDDQYEEEKALNELNRRITILVNSMQRARISSTVLNTVQILDLLHRELNKESPLKPSAIINAGGIELYSTGLGVPGEINTSEVNKNVE